MRLSFQLQHIYDISESLIRDRNCSLYGTREGQKDITTPYVPNEEIFIGFKFHGITFHFSVKIEVL